MKSIRRFMGALGAILVVAGCAATQVQLPVAATAEASGGQARVRPGDRVVLRIWDEPEMSDTFSVNEIGSVTLPKLGQVPVDRQEIGQLQDSLRQAYAVYLRNPSIEIRVLRRVAVLGEVKEPGIYLADLTMTLPDLIAQAGGLTEAGNANTIIVQRGEQRIRYGRRDRGRLLLTELRSGDQIVVGQRSWFARNPMIAITSTVSLVGYLATVVLPAIDNLFKSEATHR